MVETGVIIRTKNEEEWIGICLEKVFRQTYKNFEVIIVDSESTDRTLEIAKKFPVKIFKIKSENFSYPYALNFGIEKSRARKFIVIISAHSIPVSDVWLEKGISNFRNDEKILGVYGPLKALPGSSVWDKIFYSFLYYTCIIFCRRKKQIVRKSKMGVLGFTNAIISIELWRARKLNENFGNGGEDGEWADYWMKKGFVAVKDRDFTVYHSHNLSFIGWIKQYLHWKSVSKPSPFSRDELRKFRKSKIFE